MIWIWWHELLIPWQLLANLAWHLEKKTAWNYSRKLWRPFVSRRERESKANVFLDLLIFIKTSCQSAIETIHCSRLLYYVLYDLLMCVWKNGVVMKRDPSAKSDCSYKTRSLSARQWLQILFLVLFFLSLHSFFNLHKLKTQLLNSFCTYFFIFLMEIWYARTTCVVFCLELIASVSIILICKLLWMKVPAKWTNLNDLFVLH